MFLFALPATKSDTSSNLQEMANLLVFSNFNMILVNAFIFILELMN